MNKHRDVLPYIVFGVLTTLVNIVVYWLLAHPLGWPVMVSTVVAWLAAVLFAFVTNRRWVFRSDARGASEILGEGVRFFACRAATGVLDWLIMYVFVTRLHLPDVPIKAIANVVVIVLNYIASRCFIFRRRKGS